MLFKDCSTVDKTLVYQHRSSYKHKHNIMRAAVGKSPHRLNTESYKKPKTTTTKQCLTEQECFRLLLQKNGVTGKSNCYLLIKNNRRDSSINIRKQLERYKCLPEDIMD